MNKLILLASVVIALLAFDVVELECNWKKSDYEFYEICTAKAVIPTPEITNTPIPTITIVPTQKIATQVPTQKQQSCDPSYPDVCIPPKSEVGDLDCGDVIYKRFRVLPPDPHKFDGNKDGIGCES